eukprot:GHRR01027753.1.p1 GENE.GHRR01027753.1~~GHRR01027753.1.p1  ORF type:complete len:103 (+),score=25.44 GHRR01027753.1:96-404(+)
MAAAALFLGLDVGTQGVKAVVYDSKGHQIVGRGAHLWNIIKSDVPGRAEQHPATWVEVQTMRCKFSTHVTLPYRYGSQCLRQATANGYQHAFGHTLHSSPML